jgi:hypothetical protein
MIIIIISGEKITNGKFLFFLSWFFAWLCVTVLFVCVCAVCLFVRHHLKKKHNYKTTIFHFLLVLL